MTVKTVDCGVGASPPPSRRASIKSGKSARDVTHEMVQNGFMRHVSADSGIGMAHWNVPYNMQQMNINPYHTIGYAQQNGAFNPNFLPVVYPNQEYRGTGYTDIEIKSHRSDGTQKFNGAYDSINLGTNMTTKMDDPPVFNDVHPDTQAKQRFRNLKEKFHTKNRPL